MNWKDIKEKLSLNNDEQQAIDVIAGIDELIIITTEEYEQLLARDSELSKLEAWGVDNWSGYSDALSQNDE